MFFYRIIFKNHLWKSSLYKITRWLKMTWSEQNFGLAKNIWKQEKEVKNVQKLENKNS